MKSTYKEYCQLLQKISGKTGAELKQHIRQTNIHCYTLLFGDANIRQSSMTPAQLRKLEQHRQAMIKLMKIKLGLK